MIDCWYRLMSMDAQNLLDAKVVYHRECYKNTTNKTEMEQSKARYEKSLHNISDSTLTTPKRGRPSEHDIIVDVTPRYSTTTSEPKTLRSQATSYKKELCIICQKEGGKLHKVEFNNTGVRMFDIAKKLPDQQFFIRMNSTPNASDAVANDVQYHLKCWVLAQRVALNSSPTINEVQEMEDIERVLADIEIVNAVTFQLNASSEHVLDMKSINRTYNNFLLVNPDGEETNYKRYLKQLLTEHVPNIVFSRPPARNESERVCSSSSQGKAIETYRNNPDDYNIIFEAAKIVREEVLKHQDWKFTGDFEGFHLPRTLRSLLQWIVFGPNENIDNSPKKKHSVSKSLHNISQIIVKSTKTKRQMDYIPTSEVGFRDSVETPFAVGLALHVHKETRSKKMIDCLSDLDLGITYDKLMKIENEVGNAVMKQISENDGVFLPPTIDLGRPLHFAIDNTDFHNDTPDGKTEFHGTGQIIFQKRGDKSEEHLKIERNINANFKFQHNPFKHLEICYKPTPPVDNFPDFCGIIPTSELDLYQSIDRAWGLCQVLEKDRICSLPTWAAYNSLITDALPVTTCQGLPLYPGAPTDWSNLYAALKIVQGINVLVTRCQKTIVSLDLQLYAKCMQLREKQNINENFIFRLGELHVVFAMLKVIGKYIEGSGLDRLFIEAGIYGPTTLGQIINGKHMKRGMEAYMILYLALYNVYVNNVFQGHEQMLSSFKESMKELYSISYEDTKNFRRCHGSMMDSIESNGVLDIIRESDITLQQQAKFLRNYMVLYENLLLFVRASRQGNWELHLASLNSMVKYFFAHDQINYARLTPLYLATMTELEIKDNQSWNYLKENFSINKSDIPFSAIGSDHGMEQENKAMKVTGGITGLTQKQSALNRFWLVAPVLSSLSEEFCRNNQVKTQNRKQHYQLAGSTNKRISANVNKLLDVIDVFEIDFQSNDSVYNVVSKAVLPEDASSELLRHETIGEGLYHNFITERLKGIQSIWSPLKKRNLPTFKIQAKKLKVKVDGKLVQLKEERILLSRFLITARKRPELDLEECLGNYEFSVVPKSLFTQDGQPLMCTDKAKILHKIEDLANDVAVAGEETESMDQQTSKVIIIDGMAVVNSVHKDADMKTWTVYTFRKFLTILFSSS